MIPDMVRCNRVLFNRDKVMKIRSGDIFVPGDCDSNVEELSSLLGWTLLQQGTETETEESSHNDKEKDLNEEELSNLLGSCEINDEQTNHTDKEDDDDDEDEDEDD